MQMFETKDYLVWVHEFQRATRIIPLDGRAHLEGTEPTYYGDSVARWDGDTLIIESTNFKRWVLDDYFYTNPKEYRMHSDAVKFTERLRWKSPTKLAWTLTVDDPRIFTQPWTQEFEIESKPDWAAQGLFEYVCEENNRCPGGQCPVESK
jgi:hypothetical protein